MARDGSGTMSVPYNDFVSGTTISSSQIDADFADIVLEITNSVPRDGQAAPTANLPMGAFKFTNLGNGSARTDSLNIGQAQDGKLNWVDGGGTADAITATYSPAITALVDGQICFVRATTANATTTPTFSPNGLTARTIVKFGGQALVAGDIRADGHELVLRYDLANTRWELLNPNPPVGVSDGDKGDITVSASGATYTIDNNVVTYAKMQDVSATSRVLGRKTSGSGDTEECTLSEILDFIGSAAQGDILYRGASAWARLGAGTNGHFLKTQGAGANPTWAALTSPFTVSYTSTNQTITSGGSLTLAHSLGAAPKLIMCSLINVTGEAGYSTNDEVFIGSIVNDSVTGRGVSVVPDATNLNVRYGNDASSFAIIRKDTGAGFNITNANWSFKIRAWA